MLKLLFCLLLCHSLVFAKESEFDFEITDGLENIDKKEKKAQFRTVIAANIHGKEFLCEGKIRGTIIHEKRGKGGFGYDPIFVPKGHSKTFAELGKEVKNKISHRAKAFTVFLNDLNTVSKGEN